jgi:hypothetical protein
MKYEEMSPLIYLKNLSILPLKMGLKGQSIFIKT